MQISVWPWWNPYEMCASSLSDKMCTNQPSSLSLYLVRYFSTLRWLLIRGSYHYHTSFAVFKLYFHTNVEVSHVSTCMQLITLSFIHWGRTYYHSKSKSIFIQIPLVLFVRHYLWYVATLQWFTEYHAFKSYHQNHMPGIQHYFLRLSPILKVENGDAEPIWTCNVVYFRRGTSQI